MRPSPLSLTNFIYKYIVYIYRKIQDSSTKCSQVKDTVCKTGDETIVEI